ncbi:DUF262 domain-containing protein [Lacticaseibacillus suibinensis]|uniref:DUF262 domain-containing protein n=1 Tax=Lacticaseibacillus suibinensis TaxID=2486011 RepID=UPI00194412D3|nr:DUF262 domain-containing protein [Lacticaseibacillus suibinensis]
MDGKAKAIVAEVLISPSLVVPVYQRRYSWGSAQVERMMTDIESAMLAHKRSYFLGSLILDSSQGDFHEVAVIDGQQRLTTVSLLLMVLRDELVDQDPTTAEKIDHVYLIDPYTRDSPNKNRLHPVAEDQEQYLDVYNLGASAASSLFLKNYLQMRDYLRHSQLSASEWFAYLEGQVTVMAITVQGDDDPQLIFESLNSTGLDLTEADKIRNYLLMSLPPANQATAFKVWQKNEGIVHSDQMSVFYRHYLSSLEKTPKPIRESDVYEQYRRLLGMTKDFDREQQLSHETTIAYRYAKVDHPAEIDGMDAQLKALLLRLSHLNTDVYMPFTLTLLKKADDSVITHDELLASLQLLLSYLARRLAVGIATAGLNTFFFSLNRQVEHVADQFDRYDQALAYVLVHNGQSNKVFPSDEQLLEAFKTRDYYQHARSGLWFILDELNRAHGEDQDIYSRAAAGDFSIEHIMPQTMSKAWEQALGDRATEIHDHWVDRLPNLTLTGFNSQMSNRSFIEKRDMEDGYGDTAIKLNHWLTQYDHWDETTLKKREADLYTRALQVWPMPEVKDVIVEPNLNVETELSDNLDITGWKIDSYSFLDVVNASVGSWSELSDRIVDQLWTQDASRFYQAASDPNETLVTYANEGDSRNQYEPLPDPTLQILKRGMNNQRRLMLIDRLLALYQYSLSDVKVHQTNADRLSAQKRNLD